MDPAYTQFLDHAQALNSQTSPSMFAAELFWFFGGVLTSFVFCAFSLTVRGVRAGAGHVDI